MASLQTWEKSGEGLWAGLEEDEEGRLRLEASQVRKRRRVEAVGGVARGLLRYLMIVVDASASASTSDYRPTRLICACGLLEDFVRDYLSGNPLSNVGVGSMAAGGAKLTTQLSTSERTHVEALRELRKTSPSGDASLEAALDMAATALAATPDYGHREVLLVLSALATRDAGDVVKLIERLKKLEISVSVVALAAETRIVRRICTDTEGVFGVALDQAHFKALLAARVPPPALAEDDARLQRRRRPTLVEMGFPKLKVESHCRLACADSGPRQLPTTEWTVRSFTCPRCQTRVLRLPTNCPTCALPLVSSPHLAASYHHLFPVPAFREIKTDEDDGRCCFACLEPLADATEFHYECPLCGNKFCSHCDEYIHVSLHNCPGCTTAASSAVFG